MPSRSVAVTSTLTGPLTVLQISRTPSLNGRPSFATRDGFVVTPSRTPISWPSRISLMFAVSRKNFMCLLPLQLTHGGESLLYFRCRPAALGNHKVRESPEARDADLHAIVGFERTNSRGSSCENKIARQQGPNLADVTDYRG